MKKVISSLVSLTALSVGFIAWVTSTVQAQPTTRAAPQAAATRPVATERQRSVFQTPADQFINQRSPGDLYGIPFSRDLQFLGYIGGQYIGKVPAVALKPNQMIRHALWYDVYEVDGVNRKLLHSNAPKGPMYMAAFASPAAVFRVDIIFKEEKPGHYIGKARFEVPHVASTTGDIKFTADGPSTGSGSVENAVIEMNKPQLLYQFSRGDREYRWFVKFVVDKKME